MESLITIYNQIIGNSGGVARMALPLSFLSRYF